ncbi:TfoX/Sxy family protein [Dokdonella sp.]|uniref:TfoX/Sxy family protein n=1 Tax=Dokdonella sp. TaxID=2291710 RepID=UPI0031BEB82C|nr:TfoX/Sxy family protein [Dokdonella sp.]
MSTPAVKIRNVGPKSAAWLRQVGVRSTEDLARVGPVDAFLKVKRAGFRPTLNLLYSMAGALADCHWAELPEDHKQELLRDLEAAESAHPIQTRWERQKAASEDAAAAEASDVERESAEGAAAAQQDDRGLSRFD